MKSSWPARSRSRSEASARRPCSSVPTYLLASSSSGSSSSAGVAHRGDGRALVLQHGLGDLPSAARLARRRSPPARARLRRRLAERRRAADEQDGAHRDAGRGHVDQEEVIPWCFLASGSVRTRQNIQSDRFACDVQILRPSTTYASPSSTARVCGARRGPIPPRARCSPGTSASRREPSSAGALASAPRCRTSEARGRASRCRGS